MDRLIARYPSKPDGDLTLCPESGVAYQTDMTVTAAYDGEYFDKCAGYKNGEIARRINMGRAKFVDHHYCPRGPMLDVGVGAGEFVEFRGAGTFGYDINPTAVEWLKSRGRFRDKLAGWMCYSFWDVLEHVPEPETYFRNVLQGSRLLTSIPIFSDLTRIRESKHYRPGEHLYYFTATGFVDWMASHKFELLGIETFEMRAGREDIWSFAFEKVT